MAEVRAEPQTKRGWARIGTAAMLAVLMSGCATLVPRGPAPSERPPERPVDRPAPIAPGIPQDKERHRVALLVPMSGQNAGVGQSIANATMLALLDTKSERIRVTNYDTAQGAAAAANRAIADGNQLILGPLLAEDARAVGPIARRANVPVISFSNDSSVAGNGIYLLGYQPDQSIERVVQHAARNGMRSFAGLVPRGVYGERASSAFLGAVKQAGGQVTGIQTFDRSNASITSAVARLKSSSSYQALLIADSAGTATIAVPAVRRSGGANAKILGTELWNTDSSVGGNAALNGAWFASVPNGFYRQYATKYRARFGRAPFRLSSMGYDSVLLTVRIAQDWRVGTTFPESRLRANDGFVGLDGAFRFGRNGIAERALEVQEIRGGSTVTVSPAPRGFE